jgi:hypothetical protein
MVLKSKVHKNLHLTLLSFNHEIRFTQGQKVQVCVFPMSAPLNFSGDI